MFVTMAVCNRKKQVSELTEEPTGRFDRAHQLPSDLLMLHALTVNDIVFEYQVYGDKVFSNASSNEVVIADYTFRALEIGWPSYFTIAVEYAMAAVFAGSIARDPNLIQLMESKYDIAMRKARSLDSQQQTSRKLATSRFAAERRS